MAEAKRRRVIVVGGGLAGLMTTIRAVEAGLSVDLISLVPVKRSHSVCAQGGINAAKNTMGEGDSPWKHFDDSVYGGDFLQHQPLVKEMCEYAPMVIDLLDRMGLPFNRTPEGYLDFRRFGGTLFHRTAYAGATTGQQMLYALDEQVRRWEAAGLVHKYEFWDMLAIVKDEQGVCRGVVAQDLHTMEIRPFRADAVVLASGGCGMIFGKSTNSTICTGAAGARAYMAGVRYANGEFIQVHPTSIPGQDKLRLMSESARGEGGRVWVPKDGKDTRRPEAIPEPDRWYFLEDRYPAYGNLVPRDIATREIFDVCLHGRGIGGGMEVYLDLSHLPADYLDNKLGGILEIYEKFVGDDPRKVPMRVFPGVHYTMGGLWVDYTRDEQTGGIVHGDPRNQMTNVPGLYAVGEADYQYHGANRLGANSLLSCIFAGMLAGPSSCAYIAGLKSHAIDLPATIFDQAVAREQERQKQILARDGGENPYAVWRELGDLMTRNVTVIRNNKDLTATEGQLADIQARLGRCAVPDKGTYRNQSFSFARAMEDMIVLARVIARGALLRDESRGSHFKPEFEMPPLDAEDKAEHRRQAEAWCRAFAAKNEKWLKTTVAEFTGQAELPKIGYEAVDTSLIPPRPRTYGLKGAKVIEEVWAEMTGQAGGATNVPMKF
ncbi:MAG: Fumarate reductase flavoprotein subunit [Phycisphaerae bacterium]|nr:Fumarate reductase flavoprotein subunit [Phycisphaerae bacterium]